MGWVERQITDSCGADGHSCQGETRLFFFCTSHASALSPPLDELVAVKLRDSLAPEADSSSTAPSRSEGQ